MHPSSRHIGFPAASGGPNFAPKKKSIKIRIHDWLMGHEDIVLLKKGFDRIWNPLSRHEKKFWLGLLSMLGIFLAAAAGIYFS